MREGRPYGPGFVGVGFVAGQAIGEEEDFEEDQEDGDFQEEQKP